MLGIVGGGQLGRMLASEARKTGFGVIVLDPQPDCPAAALADEHLVAGYDDTPALERLGRLADVVTFEFENVAAEPLAALEAMLPIRPRPAVLHICQHREREKLFLRSQGIPCAPFAVVDSPDELNLALQTIGFPAVLKTASFGYDGKGQAKISAAGEVGVAWQQIGGQRAVLEGWVDYIMEFSIVCARGLDGEIKLFPAAENQHRNHILDISIVPARLPETILHTAADLTRRIACALDVVGLIAVEFFLTRSGEVLVNELAPRPHNSGHYTMNACATSQFEQQLRAVCGWPLGETTLLQPAVMVNLLGDLWAEGEPPWYELLALPGLSLHLYGKKQARPGRKMGHVTICSPTREEALALAARARRLLRLPLEID